MHSEHNESKKHHEDSEHSSMVTITLDGNPVQIPKDTYRISDLKVKLGIPADYEFELVEKDGEFQPLSDNAELEIKKPMIFISHVRCGASS